MTGKSEEQDIQYRSLSAEQREQLMIQVAKLYYDLELTMSEIGKTLGLTRWQVGRIDESDRMGPTGRLFDQG